MVLWLLQGEYVWNIGWEKKLETERAAVLRKAQQQKEDEEKAAQRGGALRLSNLSVLEEDDLSAELERIRIKKQKQAEEAALLAAKRVAFDPDRCKGKFSRVDLANIAQRDARGVAAVA